MNSGPSELTSAQAAKKPAQKLERVVLFHDFSQALGGASYLVQVLIGELKARGIPLTFIAGDDGANFEQANSEQHDGANGAVEFLPLHGKALLERAKLDALTSGFYNRSAATRTRAWIAANDTPGTVYHVHGWCKILTPAIFGPLRSVADRVVLHGHDYFNCCPNGGFFNFVTQKDCLLRPLSRQCLASQCDKSSYAEKLWRTGREGLRRRLNGGGVVGGGTNVNRLLMIHPGQEGSFRQGGWPSDKLHAVPNPVSPLSTTRIDAKANQGVIFIGRISAEKGADLAAAACAKAGVPITFVGDGSEMEAVRRINPHAKMLGRLDRAGVAEALSKARLAVMPSRWSEPFGLVALEAIGSGVPAIVSDRALVGPQIAEAGFGLSLDTQDIDAFAAAISHLSSDDVAVAQMSQAGHARYLDLCNSQTGWADGIIEHYRDVLSVPKSAN